MIQQRAEAEQEKYERYYDLLVSNDVSNYSMFSKAKWNMEGPTDFTLSRQFSLTTIAKVVHSSSEHGSR